MISAVYCCMDRTDNLLKSLQSWSCIDRIHEIIIVDWSCQKPLVEYKKITEINKIKIIRVNDQKFFSMTKGYNLAFSYTNNNIVMKLDCDYVNINSSWIKYLAINNNELNNFFITGDIRFAKSLTGFVLINKKHFVHYNENMKGWGYDDEDLYRRTKLKYPELNHIRFFCINDYIYHIPHDDNERTCRFEIIDKQLGYKNNIKLSHNTFSLSSYDVIKQQDKYVELIERI